MQAFPLTGANCRGLRRCKYPRWRFTSVYISFLLLCLCSCHLEHACAGSKKTQTGEKSKDGSKTKPANTSGGTMGNENGTRSSGPRPGSCTSQGGRFPPFPLEGKMPQKVRRGRDEDLPFCRLYKQKTCCARAHAEMAFVSVRRMLIGGEGSEECVAAWEALECAVCHPVIGGQPGPPAICASFCQKVFDACQDAFFASDPQSQALVPCGPRDPICARGREWTRDPTELCQLAGYQVINKSESELGAFRVDESIGAASASSSNLKCFDGSPAAVGLEMDVQHRARGSSSRKGRGLKDVRDWLASRWRKVTRGREFGENVMWLVAGFVLTAGVALMRWRAQRGRRKRAALFAARSLQEARAKQQAAYVGSSSRKTNGKSK